MKMGEIEGARKELENMKVKAEKKAPDVMKVAVGKIYTRRNERRDGMLVLSAAISLQR